MICWKHLRLKPCRRCEKTSFRLVIDGFPPFPLRRSREHAASDAVDAGVARWTSGILDPGRTIRVFPEYNGFVRIDEVTE